ncbi:MAG: hypothetical protein EZS28_000476 [Streblomastix strix]|uniref:TmcB/TmcC TPR repeats domain-containing protein n=1 Tax=Streblomastix strix TaxID=222440 RepID=A0A5J4X9Z6_9EUKA|nr:MAG: hypothetical protein EZS28_000476 [Streblomastix strix]
MIQQQKMKEDINAEIEDDDIEVSTKGLGSLDVFVAKILVPLYDQDKYPVLQKEFFLYFLVVIQMISLGAYSIHPVTQRPPSSLFFYMLGFIDGQSWGQLSKSNILFVLFGCVGVLLISITFNAVISFNHEKLLVSHRPLVYADRFLFDLFQTVSNIIFLNISISTFDCIKSETGNYSVLRFAAVQCFGNNALQIAAALFAILFSLIFLFLEILMGFCIFNNNCKHGGLFSKSSGQVEAFQRFLLFGLVFGQRMLINWHFWRGFVSMGTSALLVFIYAFYQPHYHISGNSLMMSRYMIYGVERLFMEIAFKVQGVTPVDESGNASVKPIVYIMFGVGLAVGIICSLLMSLVIKWINKRRWLLDSNNDILALPQYQSQSSEIIEEKDVLLVKNFKIVWMVERQLRFLHQKNLRQTPYILYANFCYNVALRLHKESPELLFSYATFLQQIAKQPHPAAEVVSRCRILRPPMSMRIVLALQMLEQQRIRRLKNQLQASMTRRILTTMEQHILDQVEDFVEEALGELRMFWEGLIRPQPDLWELQNHLEMMSELTTKALKLHMRLLETCSNNPTVLRSYALFTGQLLRDEGEAQVALERANTLEQELDKQQTSLRRNPYPSRYNAHPGKSRGITLLNDGFVAEYGESVSQREREADPFSQESKRGIESRRGSEIEMNILTQSQKQLEPIKNKQNKKNQKSEKKKQKEKQQRNQSLLLKQSNGFNSGEMDTVIEINGQNTSSMLTNSNIILGTQSGIAHIIGFSAQVGGFIVMIIISESVLYISMNGFEDSLELIHTIGNLGYYTTRLSCSAIDLFLHEQEEWDANLFNNGEKNIALLSVPLILTSLTQSADAIEHVTQNIYQVKIIELQPWEAMDIDIQFYKWDTASKRVNESTVRVLSLLGAETSLVQQVRIITSEAYQNQDKWPQISSSKQNMNESNASDPPLSSSSFYEALMYILANPLQPIFEGCKRAIIDLFNNSEKWRISVTYLYPFLLFGLSLIVIIISVIVEFIFLRLTGKQRVKAYKHILELSESDVRQELQKTIVAIMNVGSAEEFGDKENEEEYERQREEEQRDEFVGYKTNADAEKVKDNQQQLKALKKNANRLKALGRFGQVKDKRLPVDLRRANDMQWEQELDAHIVRLVELYSSIPQQVQITVYKVLLVNMIGIMLLIAMLMIVYFIYTINFSETSANIVMIGTYQSLLMMVKFVSARMIAPSDKVTPPVNYVYNMSTNACFNNLDHLSSNGIDLMELLGCLGEYAIKVAHRGYFDAKVIDPDGAGYAEFAGQEDMARMSQDVILDSIQSYRMNHDVISNALLQKSDCLGQSQSRSAQQSQQSNEMNEFNQQQANLDIDVEYEYEEDKLLCTIPLSQRVFRKERGNLFGMMGLESRLRHNIRLLSKLYMNEQVLESMNLAAQTTVTETLISTILPEHKFIQSVLHYDLAIGGNKLGLKLLNNAKAEMKSTQGSILGLSIFSIFVHMILCIGCCVAILYTYRQIGVQTLELEQLYKTLLVSSEEEEEQKQEGEYNHGDDKQADFTPPSQDPAGLPFSFISQQSQNSISNLVISTAATATFQQSMHTGVGWMDEGRQHIADTAQSVVESQQRNESASQLIKQMDMLITATSQVLNKEELVIEGIINEILKKYRPQKKKKVGLKSPSKDDNKEQTVTKFTAQQINSVMMQLSIFQAGYAFHKREHTILHQRLVYVIDLLRLKIKEQKKWKLNPFSGDSKNAQRSKNVVNVMQVVTRQVAASLFQEHFRVKDKILMKFLNKLQKEYLQDDHHLEHKESIK